MRISRGSLVFRLWLALSFVATLFTILALSLYFIVGVKDDVAEAHRETGGKIDAVIATATVLRSGATNVAPGASPIIEELGIIHVDVLDEDGVARSSIDVGVMKVQTNALDTAALESLRDGDPVSRRLRFSGGRAKLSEVSVARIIAGDSFGEERIVPLASLTPGQTGYLRVVARYDGLSDSIVALLLRSCSTAALIVSALLVCSWPFLQHFVGNPLRRYSAMALQIAGGRGTRMPTNGTDELSELGRAINGMADALRHEATVDALTGLYNMRHFSSTMETHVARALDNNSGLSLFVADLDRFKPINDTFGHQAGDLVLQVVAEAFGTWAGRGATCWRLGGDEFVAAIPVTDADDGLERAAQLRKTIAALSITLSGRVVHPSISVGVATYPGDADSAGALFGIADRRMYMAKALLEEVRQIADTPAA